MKYRDYWIRRIEWVERTLNNFLGDIDVETHSDDGNIDVTHIKGTLIHILS